ncbi:hypothetical protein ES288_D11G278600v1 [Gossypium darwinii]|uniref:Uncharacterized protein n=3 Tax=Gossypium TaxID=3633 RepID=A0A5D2ITB6_GOSTO|nr:hypothetical protein ES288_D11G278600v1 [Gossypium darwinii]TYH45662.1 hypothetical protein ES332_D11G281200v1 [Gossypium tomentosum]
MNKGKLESKSYLPLFETRPARGRQLFQLFSASISITICFIWVYRLIQFKHKINTSYDRRDPGIEPPIMAINTVLSVMAYEYTSEKLSVHPSDDGCSDLTFYALLEAASFSRIWLPFCRKLKVEPRLPEAYFRKTVKHADDSAMAKECLCNTQTQPKSYDQILKNYINSFKNFLFNQT